MLLSTSNENKTDGDIMEMGQRLATEVKFYVHNQCADVNLNKVSFIGHSLGGLIIRAALPYLAEFSPFRLYLQHRNSYWHSYEIHLNVD